MTQMFNHLQLVKEYWRKCRYSRWQERSHFRHNNRCSIKSRTR